MKGLQRGKFGKHEVSRLIIRSDQLTAEIFQHRRDLSLELAVPVEDQIQGYTIFGESLS
jgi:hypothetical protein